MAIKRRFFIRRYLRAYCLLAFITFTEMLIGLSVLRKPYAFLFAAVIAFVDFLPVFGAGTVLVPWILIDLINGYIPSAIGLAVLYGVSLLIRQMAEPRLVGNSLGIHPLLSLAAMYAGFRLFGLPGMVLSPFVAVLLKAVTDGNQKAYNEKKPE